MAEEVKYNNTLVSGRADETLSYTRYIKDESSGKSTKELLDEKVNKTDQLGTTQIADKAVTNEKLAEHSVDNSKLSPDSVSYEKIQDGAVITEKIQDKAVTTEKVEEKAITNSKLGDQSVDGRVVREASLESKHFANESVTTEKVARKSITKDKLADNSVDDSKVVDGSIGNAKLSPDSVTTEKIKDSSVTNEKVANDTLGIEKFDPELRKTIQAATGLPEDLTQMIQDVDKSVKQLHEKDTDLQSQVNNNQQKITDNKSAQDAKNASLDENMAKLNTRDDQITETLKNISATGGASVASAVTYDNTTSQLTSANIQGAVDELQGAKIDKTSILQESGEAEDKVMSQKAVSDKLSNLSNKIEGTHIAVPKTPINGSLKSDGTITTEYGLCHIMLDVSKFRDANITVEQGLTSKQYAFLSSLNDNKVIFINGGGRVEEGIANVKIPKDAVYLYILTGEKENPSLPSSISTSYDTKSLQTQINEKQNILTAGKHIVIKDNVVSVDEAIDNLNRQILGYGIEVPQQVTDGSLKSDGTITTEYGLCHIMLDVSDLAEERISVNSSIDPFQYAFLKSFSLTSVVFADGCTRVTGKMEKVMIPQDANYLYILCGDTNSPTLPSEIITSIDNTGLLKETNNILKETRKPFFINSKDEKGNWQYEIYIPTSDIENYIRIPFCHVIDTSINADSWRIYTAFLNDGSKDLYRIVNNGEWEMALQIKGRPDFIGGSQHGDEVVQYMNSFVDGVIAETPYSYKGEHNYFNELTFIEKTDLFDPSDNVTKVAEHIKKYTFSKAGINIKQKIEWLGSYELTYSYLAMLPIERGNSEKQITDRWYDNKTYKVYDVSLPNFRGYPIEMKHGCSAQFICGSTSSINASVEVVYQKPFIENCISFLSDSEYFNKIYFDFCGESYTVNSGDIWESDVNYKLDCSKQKSRLSR